MRPGVSFIVNIGEMLKMIQQIFYIHKYASLINASKETAPDIIEAWKRD